VNLKVNSESYIKKIVEETGLSKKEIQQMVQEKKAELKGLITDEGALFVIAKELGVDVKEENKDLLKDIDINISDITTNMKNIVIAGRIKVINSVRSFDRDGGQTGYVGSFILNDKTGDIRIVLWDDHVKLFNNPNFEINELVKIVNGTPRKSKYGGLEIHVGKFSNIVLSPEDIDYKLFPKIKFKANDISEINLNLSSVSIEGKVIQKSQISKFTRKDGSEGKVGSLTIMDPTGTIRVTFWNEDTEKLNSIDTGDSLSIINLSPRQSSLDSKVIDLHANPGTTLKKKSIEVEIEEKLIDNIKTLQNQTGIVSFKGVISSVDNLKKVSLKNGEEVSLLGFTVSDETDGIRITLWRDKADEFVDSISVGKGILLKNGLVKYSNFSGRNEISLIKDSELEFVDITIKNIKEIEPRKSDRTPNFSGEYTKIESIDSTDNFEIKGFIVKEINKIVIYEACPNCNKKIDNCSCDKKEEPVNRMILSTTVDDNTSTIRATFFGEIAEKLIGQKTDLIKKLMETPDYERFLEKKSKELLGKDIIIKGRGRFSDFSNKYEISVYDFTEVNINKELDKVMKEIET